MERFVGASATVCRQGDRGVHQCVRVRRCAALQDSHGSVGLEGISIRCRDASRTYEPAASGEGSLIFASTSISLMCPDRPERNLTSRRGTCSH